MKLNGFDKTKSGEVEKLLSPAMKDIESRFNRKISLPNIETMTPEEIADGLFDGGGSSILECHGEFTPDDCMLKVNPELSSEEIVENIVHQSIHYADHHLDDDVVDDITKDVMNKVKKNAD